MARGCKCYGPGNLYPSRTTPTTPYRRLPMGALVSSAPRRFAPRHLAALLDELTRNICLSALATNTGRLMDHPVRVGSACPASGLSLLVELSVTGSCVTLRHSIHPWRLPERPIDPIEFGDISRDVEHRVLLPATMMLRAVGLQVLRVDAVSRESDRFPGSRTENGVTVFDQWGLITLGVNV